MNTSHTTTMNTSHTTTMNTSHTSHTSTTATTTTTTLKGRGARVACAGHRGETATPGRPRPMGRRTRRMGRRAPHGPGRHSARHPLRAAGRPAHGYGVMRRLEEMSGGLWRPSPGSVYPHLQMLEDEGMVSSSEQDGTRVFHLTDAGVAEAANGTPLPWQGRGRATTRSAICAWQ